MEDEFLYDVRIRERLLEKGNLTAEAIEKREAALADLEAQAETIALEQPARVAAEKDRS